jgi:hypothetical protein
MQEAEAKIHSSYAPDDNKNFSSSQKPDAMFFGKQYLKAVVLACVFWVGFQWLIRLGAQVA